MSIISWLKSVTSGHLSLDAAGQHPPTFAKGEEKFQGLNMKDALDAHNDWTHRLERIIDGTSKEILEVETVACDDRCALGRWIHGHAAEHFGKLDEFHELKQVHADFHREAGELLKNAITGELQEAKSALQKLKRTSGHVQLTLIRLYSQVHQ